MYKMLYRGFRFVAVALALMGIIGIFGCSSVSDSATVSYDPTMTPPMEVQRQADMQCGRVNKHAIRRASHAEDKNTRLRYDDFDCVDDRRDDRR